MDKGGHQGKTKDDDTGFSSFDYERSKGRQK
jgi:hypothetical protein